MEEGPRPAALGPLSALGLSVQKGDWSASFTVYADGRQHGGHVSGGFVHQAEGELAIEEVVSLFAAARALEGRLPPEATPGGDQRVVLSLAREGAPHVGYAWPADTRPADPELLALVERLEAIRIGGW